MIKWKYEDIESIKKLTDEELLQLDFEVMEACAAFRKAQLQYTEEMNWLIRVITVEINNRRIEK